MAKYRQLSWLFTKKRRETSTILPSRPLFHLDQEGYQP